jgi:hypothetical protein
MALVLAVSSASITSQKALAAIGACTSATATNSQAGMGIPNTTVFGAQAVMGYKFPQLCTEGTHAYPSFSTAWVAIVSNGITDRPFDIFQIGLFNCQSTGCPTGFSAAFEYLVWAYGRQGTSSCSQVHPSAVKISVSSGSSATYTVHRTTDADNNQIYAVAINGVQYAEEPPSNLDSCWPGGPGKAIYHDEVGQPNDQSGGTTASHRLWTTVKWQDGSFVWHSMSYGTSLNCNDVGYSSQKCKTDGSLLDKFSSWDSRL